MKTFNTIHIRYNIKSSKWEVYNSKTNKIINDYKNYISAEKKWEKIRHVF